MLLLEQGQALVDHVDQQVDLGVLGAVGVVEAQVVGDVAQRKAEALAAQDQDQPGAVAAAEDAGGADPLGREQALGLVEADGAGRDAELAGEVGDREQVAVFALRPVHSSCPSCAAYSSRSSFLQSLPIRVLGSWSLKMISRGISSLLSCSPMNFLSSASVMVWPSP